MTTTPVIPPSPSTPAPVPDEPPARRRRDRAARLRRAPAGGRWLVWVGRILLWVALLTVVVNGLWAIFPPLNGLWAISMPAGPATTPVETDAGETVLVDPAEVWPREAAGAFAAAFAGDYLTWHPERRGERMTALAGYLSAEETGRHLAWNGEGEQEALAVHLVDLDVLDEQRAVATVAAHVRRQAIDGEDDPVVSWLRLAVPLYHDGEGRLAVTDAPAFVAAPEPAAAPQAGDVEQDIAAAQELWGPMASFFRAYAEGQPSDLSYFLAADASVTGLNGLVGFDELERIVVPVGGEHRDVIATVRWRNGAAAVTQTYRVTVLHEHDRWYIADVGAHVHGDNEHDGDAESP